MEALGQNFCQLTWLQPNRILKVTLLKLSDRIAPKGLPSSATGCPWKQLSHCPWWNLKGGVVLSSMV